MSNAMIKYPHKHFRTTIVTWSEDDDDGRENVGKKNELAFFQT